MRTICGRIFRLTVVFLSDAGRRGSTNLWVSLVGLAALTPLIWCVDLVEGSLNKTVINLLYATIPLLVFIDDKSSRPWSRRLNWGILVLLAVLTTVLAIVLGDEYDLSLLKVNGSMLFLSFPALVIS